MTTGPAATLARAPVSTYRLQFNRFFTFSQAAALLDYLEKLGIGDCYASPLLRARPGSLHGYDVTDHSMLNPELGGEDDFRTFARDLRRRGMGVLLDIVPNHMCVADPSNAWWWDVLENGPSSPYAQHFDIDWNPPKEELANQVLLPVLGDQYGHVLEDQGIQVTYENGAFQTAFYGTRLPIAPRSWPWILEPALAELKPALGESDSRVLEFESILTALSYLPPRTETDEVKIRERQREKEVIKRRLAGLVEASDEVRRAVEASLVSINGRRGDPRSFDRLEQLLQDQAYRLSFWRVAADEINYRRFFDINELAAIRVEDPPVFAAVHRFVFELIREGWVTGLRVDHPDGLFEPEKYFRDLQAGCRIALGAGAPAQRFFVVAEKILVGDEDLRPGWAIEGTTGYGFLNYLNGLFVDARNRRAFSRLYSRFTGWHQSYDDLVYECKGLILRTSMSGELNVLAAKLDRISEQHRWSRDFTRESLREALREVIAVFPIYRTYVSSEALHPEAEDERYIRAAIESAKRRNPATSESIFDFIGSVLLQEHPEGLSDDDRAERRLFAMRFQQFTGPVMAKGLEDTAFYRYCPLASLNEVGADLRHFGISTAFFHRKNLVRQQQLPNALLATSTHDSKRGEDVRGRINVLSEIPAQWERAIRSWHALNRKWKTTLAGKEAPDPNDEYLLYQTLIGAWPLGSLDSGKLKAFARRIQAYMEKALREAKVHTSWVSPNAAYEEAVHRFVAHILSSPENEFVKAFTSFEKTIIRAAILNGLSQVLLKITAPGIPDFYQGSEIWDLRLVDPDNREPVDYRIQESLLARLGAAGQKRNPAHVVAHLLANPNDGGIKLYVTAAGLRFRRERRELFATGEYIPLHAAGEKQHHVIAFARTLGDQAAITVAGRFFTALGATERWPLGAESWCDTALILPRKMQDLVWDDVLTGERLVPERQDGKAVLPLARIFSHMTAALLAGRRQG